MSADILLADLQNGIVGYTVAETGSSPYTFTVSDLVPTVVYQRTTTNRLWMIKNIRELYLLDPSIIPSVTTTQRNAATGVSAGYPIYNQTEGRIECYNGSSWPSSAGAGTMLPVAFGEMVEDNSSGSSINTTTKLWDTASVGELDPNGLITFVNGTNEDYLLVGTGGAGTYQLHFSITGTNAGGNEVVAGIHLNDVEVDKMRDTHDWDSAEKRDLRGQGFLELVDADKIKLHVVSSTASDVVTVFHAHITMKRMT